MDNEVPQGQEDNVSNELVIASSHNAENVEWRIANVRKDYDDLLRQERNELPPVDEIKQTFSSIPGFSQPVHDVYWQRWLMVG